MTWWQIVLFIVLLGVVSYLFSSLIFSIFNESAIKVIGTIVGVYAIGTGCFYLTLAMWHKFLGPYLFK